MGFWSKFLGVDPDSQGGTTAAGSPDPVAAIPDGADFRTKVEFVLDQVRPSLKADGGDVQLVEILGRSVRVKLTGACDGCASSALTLRHGIEGKLRAAIPEFEDLIPF